MPLSLSPIPLRMRGPALPVAYLQRKSQRQQVPRSSEATLTTSHAHPKVKTTLNVRAGPTMPAISTSPGTRPIARGAQLPLMMAPTPTPQIPIPHHDQPLDICPRCAGPTASHGSRAVCVICGFGAKPRPFRRRHKARYRRRSAHPPVPSPVPPVAAVALQ